MAGKTAAHAHPAAKSASKHLRKGDQGCASGSCGKHFKTKDEAAKAALDDVNKKSIAENREYAGQIYKNPDGTYGYTDAVPGSGDESHPSSSPVPDGTETVGNYHTHGDYSAVYQGNLTRASDIPNAPAGLDAEADNFSDADIKQYQQANSQHPGFTGYLGTPSGNMRSYDPTTKTNTPMGPLR